MKVKLVLAEEILGTKASNPDLFGGWIAEKAEEEKAEARTREAKITEEMAVARITAEAIAKEAEEEGLDLDTAAAREKAGTTIFHRMPRKMLLEVNTMPAPDTLLFQMFDGKSMPGYDAWKTGDPEELLWGIWDYQVKGFLKEAAKAFNNYDKEFRNGLEPLKAFKTKIATLIFVYPRFIPFTPPTDFAGAGKCQRPLRADTAQGPRVTIVSSETMPVGTQLEFEIKCLNRQFNKYCREFLKYGALQGLGQWRNSGKGRFSFALAEMPADRPQAEA